MVSRRGGPDSVKFISVSFAIMTTFKTEGALDIWKIDQYSTRPSYIGPSLPSVVSDMTDIIKTIANEYIPSLWRLGFHVIYASLDWDAVTQCVVSPPPSGADQSGVTSGGPLMYGWDFVMAIPQESINTHYKGRVEYHFKKPGKGEGEVIHNGLRCTTLRIELLSHEHAIFWVSIDRITHSRPNDEGWSVRPFRLAFHTKLGMRIAPASYTSATGYSVWEVYIDTSADVSFLPQYSALSHGIYNIVDLVKSEFIPFLTKDKHNVIAHVPVLLAAVEGSTSPYAMKNAKFCTTFSCNIESVTKENWHKTITGRRRAAAPILLIYGKQPGADRTPCIPPSWGPYAFQTKYGNGLSTGTVAIAKDTYIRYVIPAQLARLNDITALVPTIQLACNCSCDDVVYLESSGDGLKATAEMWKPDTARPWSSQTYTFEFERTSSCDVQTVIDEVRKIKKLYECKTSNTLTISDRAILGAGPTANIKGNIELRCIESKATARLTWTWNVIPDTDVDVPSVETLLASVMTIPSPAESMVRGDVRAEDESDKESRILAKRLKDAFRAVVQRAKLPIPIAGIPAVAKACGHLDHDKTVRCNENGDLVLGVYPRTENSAETPSILR
ncbi:hypothetical protein C8Q70DRAFT_1018093 [Cubamyces menziesii]|nr:hypothetical protein C8Q70DRAFT_1018093 [Cubamyces menziesii]